MFGISTQLGDFHLIQAYHDQFERDYPKEAGIGGWSDNNAEKHEPPSLYKSTTTELIKSILEIMFELMFSKMAEKYSEPGLKL